ncbi:MAG TPA: hypothetical protein VHC95_00280 [Opitutales bacterium]|nr:hypothetical protein [Opitutales bacterium]
MHLKTVSPCAALLAGLVLASASPVAAQQTAVDTAQSVNTNQQLQKPLKPSDQKGQDVPLLYEGELEDLGPQYVLQPHERPKYLQVMGDLQVYHTDNAALVPANKIGTDVSVFTVEAAYQSQAKVMFGDVQTQFRAGFRFQSYWYGIISGRDKSTSASTYNPVNLLDFQIYSPFVEVSFKKNNWYGGLALRYAAYTNSNQFSDETFYQEWVPSGSFGYQWVLDQHRIVQVQYDGDFRSTNTDEKGTHPTGWEDRADNSISLIHSYILGEHWIFQPSYRLMWSKYTNPERYRSDIYNTLSFMVAYYFNENLSARAFTSIEWRNSSMEGGVDNSYQNWNIGVGVSLTGSF